MDSRGMLRYGMVVWRRFVNLVLELTVDDTLLTNRARSPPSFSFVALLRVGVS